MSWGVMGGHLGWGVMEEGWRKGPWTAEEDKLLIEYVRVHGEGRWNSVARLAGLKRNGKSCRLRWVNYLRPDLKRGQITPHEESIILELHARWGNRWSTIARSLPGRTDNEIKNYWRTHFKKKAKSSSDSSEKTKNRLLRRQQFQQQQQQQVQRQQQQQQEQEQQLLQLSHLDMKKVMSLLDEQTNENNKILYVPQMKQDLPTTTNYTYTNMTEEQLQSYNYYQFASSYVPMTAVMPEGANEDNMLWDGLWNLDDGHGNFVAAACAANKACFQNLVAPSFC